MRLKLPLVVLLMLPAESAFAQFWDSPYRPYARSAPESGARYRRPVEERYGWRESWPPAWSEQRRYRDPDDDDDDDVPQHRQRTDVPQGPKLLSGGDRPNISPMPPRQVSFGGSYKPGTIVIETAGRQLFLVTGSGQALRYPISVGRDGFQWTGTQTISRIADWPDWHPPAEMRQRQPHLPEKMTGGVRNPLGAKALYLGNSLYRIHGTNDARTIGLAASSGCFRMMNGHVVDLAKRVGVGTTVVVLNRLPRNIATNQSGAVAQR
jgi:lipoprotein-anchoring transpeptidase ErfK/SrfK